MKDLAITQALATMSIPELVANTNYIQKLVELGNYPDDLGDFPDTHNYTMGKVFLELHDTKNDKEGQLGMFNDLSIEQLSCLEVYVSDCEVYDQTVSIRMEHIKDIINLTPGNFKIIIKG